MEKEGLQRGITKLEENGLCIDTIVTDRHCQIAKWIKDELPHIHHFYDAWHLAKGVKSFHHIM
jgi:solute carrier family 8 (sodium/calcium exchanger)